jgi:hypothetical protein
MLQSTKDKFELGVTILPAGTQYGASTNGYNLSVLAKSLEEQKKLPFFLAIGNHDCGSSLMGNVWRARYGSEYYAFRYKNALFVMMNSEDPPIPDSYIPVLRTLEQQVKTDPVNGE